MNKNKIIEQAKEQVISYYRDFIDKCIDVYGIDLHTIINDCVAAGFNNAQSSTLAEKGKTELRCTLCHSTDVKMKMWDNPNNQGQYFEPSDDDDDIKNCWCNRCETHVALEPIDEKVIEYQPQYVYKCSECGSEDVEIKQWVLPNQGDKLAGNDCPEREDCWCNDCQEHYKLDVIQVSPLGTKNSQP